MQAQMSTTDKLLQELVPILILCVVITLVVQRLPKVKLGHSPAFLRRRVLNWLPLGLTYAFLYMGRYNLNALTVPLPGATVGAISHADFGNIDAIGSMVYGLAFLINGPLTDRWGGRFTILLAAAGAAACNLAIGVLYLQAGHPPSVHVLMVLFGLNMYFQSFGAVSIVKVNAAWFHLRERGTFGGIFGILISLGLYFAYDAAPMIASLTSPEWLFLAPAACLALFFGLSYLGVQDTPGQAGCGDFDVADASSGQSEAPESSVAVIKRLLTNRVILVIAFISLSGGFLRNGILKWYRTFAGGVGLTDSYVYVHWGMVACIAGITGGMFAGIISDHLFNSRRPPVATVLFGVVLLGAIAIIPALAFPASVSWVVVVMMMATIGVNGMLSGVASQDFAGRRNAGTATGLIDGFVYFGTALQAQVYGALLPEGHTPAAANINNWYAWPIAMLPMAAIGLGLSLWIYRAVVKPAGPKATGGGGH
jgi:OPA family glycerol-3-phosphate transporter-like MFS transporter